VQHDVAALLEHGLNPPTPPTGAPAATSETAVTASNPEMSAEPSEA